MTERAEAYYFGFDLTGEPAVDVVLREVARAGKAAHHTEGWRDEDAGTGDGSATSEQLIQRAAGAAAKEVAALRAQAAELEAECTQQAAECERFKAQRDAAAVRAGLRLAERDAALTTLKRVRLTAGAWRDFASGIAEKAWTRESTEGREGYGEALAECAEEIEAVLAGGP